MRVTNSNRSGAGSGTCIDYDEAAGDVLVLSACHIFFDTDGQPIDARGPAEVIMFDGSKYTAPMLGMYVKNAGDCALLRVHTGKPYPFVPLAQVDPQPGSKILKVGFPAWKDGARDIGPGTVTGYEQSVRLTARMRTMSGDSGGGVFDENGELVGVVSGHETQGRNGPPTDRAFCCCLQPIRSLIARVGWKGGQGNVKQGGIGNHNQIVQVFPQQTKPSTQPDPVTPKLPAPSVPTPPVGSTNPFAEVSASLSKLEAMVAEIKAQKAMPGPQGEKGEQGLAGKPGTDGKPGMAGPAGSVGPVGPDGANGVAGKDGVNGKDADPALIASAVQDALAKQPPMTAILKDQNGNVINTATFGPNQPLILRLVPVTPVTPPTPSSK